MAALPFGNLRFRPIADISEMPDAAAVRCFRVLIHGQFERPVHLGPADRQTRGFYTTRWVVAGAEESAVPKAFHSAERELQQWSDIRDGLVGIEMEAEEVDVDSWWRWLRGGGRGFAFYFDDEDVWFDSTVVKES